MTSLLPMLLFVSLGNLEPLLDRNFPESGLNYLLVDVSTREIVAARWPDLDTPIPVGSLVKPFTALAFNGPFPEFECKGTASRCWLARGHGRLRFTEALAHSCNAYFLNLARSVDANALTVVTAKYGIAGPANETPETRIGLGSDWRVTPLALARAYSELVARSGEPRVSEILAGLERAARDGTANAFGPGVMAKTGTAPCVAAKRDAGDGFAIVLDPSEAPRRVLLVRVHGVPGASAAKSAASILRVVRAGK